MSTEDHKVQLVATVNTADAEQGFQRVKQGAADMGQAVGQAGEKAGAGLGKLGDAGTGAAAKLDGSTKSIIASIQRTTAAMEAGERGSTQYFESLAKQRGVSVDTLRPYLDQLQAAQRAQATATGGLDKMGVSAKQTAAALRGVPAQFTDIFTSLQGGQAPLTVLLQQGGQLKDMFGGVGNAARAMGGYVLGLVNPFTVAAAAAGALFVAYRQGASEAEAFNRQAILSGGNARITAAGMAEMARSVRETSDAITQSQASEFLTGIATAGKVGEENLKRFTLAALEFEAAGGGAASEVGKAFADLANEPLKASVKLNESMNYLTRSTYDQIKALEEQGKFTDAAKVAQEAYATAIEQRTPQLVENLGYVESAWKRISGAARSAWDAVRDAGRATELDQANAQLQNAINTGATEAEVRALEVKRNRLQQIADVQAGAARAQQEQNDRVKAGVTLAEQAANADGALASQRRKVAEATAQFALATKGLAKDSEDYRRAETDYLTVVAALTKAEEDKVKRTKKMTAAEREAAEQRKRDFEVVKLRNQAVEAGFKDQQKLLDQTIAAEAKRFAARESDVEKLREQIQVEIEAAAAIGLSKPQLVELAAVKLEDAAASKERQAIDAEIIGDSPRIIQTYRDEAKALRDLAAAKRATGAKQASQDAADEAGKEAERATQEWARSAAEIERSITDALMRGFESGKGFAENLRDTVVNMFKTMVLRPLVQMGVQGGLNLLGLGGPAAGGGGGGGALGALANGASLYNQLSTGTGLIGSVLASNAAYGAAIGTTTIGAGSQAAMLAAQTGSFGAAGVAATSQAAAGAGAGASSVLSAIPGWGWALGGLALLAGSGFGKTPGEQARGGYYSSRGLDANIDNALAVTGGGGDGAYARDLITREDAGLKTFTKQTVDGVLAAAQGNAKALGVDIALGIDAGFAANLNGKGKNKNAFGYAQIFADGELAGEYSNRELGSDVTAAGAKFAQELADAAADVILAGTNFKRAGESSSQTLTRLGRDLTGVNASFDLLGVEMFETSLKGGDMASALADVFGGVEQFQQATATFFSAFYSDAEKFATQQRLLRQGFDELGIAMPRSTRDFRALVEAQDLTTEAGREMYAQLMALAPAFSEVSTAVEAAFDSISQTTASSVRDIEMSLLDNAGKYAYLDAEIESLITQLSTATLPADIERLFGQINANTTTAYGLLDPAQQKASAGEFIDRLYEAEAIAQSRLSVTGDQAATTVERQAEAVQTQMEASQVQRDAADAMLTAATEMRLAAEKMVAAANTPLVMGGAGGSGAGGREVRYA